MILFLIQLNTGSVRLLDTNNGVDRYRYETNIRQKTFIGEMMVVFLHLTRIEKIMRTDIPSKSYPTKLLPNLITNPPCSSTSHKRV